MKLSQPHSLNEYRIMDKPFRMHQLDDPRIHGDTGEKGLATLCVEHCGGGWTESQTAEAMALSRRIYEGEVVKITSPKKVDFLLYKRFEVTVDHSDNKQWNTLFMAPVAELPRNVKGCPMGRGSTLQESLEDLIFRANIGVEEKLHLQECQLKLTELRRDGVLQPCP